MAQFREEMGQFREEATMEEEEQKHRIAAATSVVAPEPSQTTPPCLLGRAPIAGQRWVAPEPRQTNPPCLLGRAPMAGQRVVRVSQAKGLAEGTRAACVVMQQRIDGRVAVTAAPEFVKTYPPLLGRSPVPSVAAQRRVRTNDEAQRLAASAQSSGVVRLQCIAERRLPARAY